MHAPPTAYPPVGQIRDRAPSGGRPAALTPAQYASQRQLQTLHSFERLPDSLSVELPESELYTQLQALERRIDSDILHKLVEVEHSMLGSDYNTPQNVGGGQRQTLRLYVWSEVQNQPERQDDVSGDDEHDSDGSSDENADSANANGSSKKRKRSPTADDQAQPAAVIDSSALPTWTLHILGQIFDAEEAEQTEKQAQEQIGNGSMSSHTISLGHLPIQAGIGSTTGLVLSNYLQSLVVQLDPQQYEGSEGIVEWYKHSSAAVSDAFEIMRQGTRDVTAQLTLQLDSSPPRFKLSPALASLLNTKEDTMHNIVSSLWQYVVKHNLQHDQQPTLIQPDVYLLHLFGGINPIPFHQLQQLLQVHLSPPDPITITYKINVSSGEPAGDDVVCYDIPVTVPSVPNAALLERLQVPNARSAADRKQIDDKLHELINDIHRHNRRREFLQAFAEQPSEVMRVSIANATKDVARTDAATAQEEIERAAVYYTSDWVHDAVDRYLHTDFFPPLQRTDNIDAFDTNRLPEAAKRNLQKHAASLQANDLVFHRMLRYLAPMFAPSPPANGQLGPAGQRAQHNRQYAANLAEQQQQQRAAQQQQQQQQQKMQLQQQQQMQARAASDSAQYPTGTGPAQITPAMLTHIRNQLAQQGQRVSEEQLVQIALRLQQQQQPQQ